MKQTFDVAVVGGGPGGSAAARLLALEGKNVALIEEDQLGGVCLNRGCIPTKFLLGATAPLGGLHDHERFGVLAGDVRVDFPALQKRKDRFVKGSVSTLAKSLQSAGVTIVAGKGTLTGPGTVAVTGGEAITAENVILATGSRSASFPGVAPDGDAVLDSTMLLALETAPKSLLVVGAGAIGMEFADFFAALGTEVTVVEGMDTLVPTEDEDIGRELAKIKQKSGIRCLTGRRVTSLATKDGQAELALEGGETLHAEKALLAVGRRPNTENLGLDAAGGSLTPRGFVAVDASLRAAPGCYAVGDCNGLALLAHTAEHQAEWVARRILGRETGEYASGPVPSCVFGHIEVMRVGRTAREAAAAGGKVSVSKAPFTVNPIAQAHASTVGFVKAVWDEDVLVGMAAVGHNVSHLVTAAQLLVLRGVTPHSLHDFMFAHPTLDEILKSALTAPREAVSTA